MRADENVKNGLTEIKNRLAASGSVTLDVKVQAGVNLEGVEAASDGTLKVKVSAQREKGKANKRMIEVLSGEFGVAKSCIKLLRGETGSRKVVRIKKGVE